MDSGDGFAHVACHSSIGYGGLEPRQVRDEDLTVRGYSFTTTAEQEIFVDVKEGLCFIALYFDNGLEAASRDSGEE